jgi:hypothetical protein
MSDLYPQLELQPVSSSPLVAPFKWRGGKRLVAPLVWQRFGRVGHYCEPFCGGAAVLLGRPSPAGLETINDLDGLLCNFWRSIKLQPTVVSSLMRSPPSDVDMRSRHAWLRDQRIDIERQLADPTYCNPLAGAWWAWGQAHAYQQRWVERSCRPVLDPTPSGPNRLDGAELLDGLAKRLQRVAVLHRDWSSVVRPSMLFRNRTNHVGVFLDPPYDGDEGLYAATAPVASAVWDWALDNANDPRLRIAVCGYDDGRKTPRGWSVMPWSSIGGGSRRHEERVWFSPHCLPAEGTS